MRIEPVTEIAHHILADNIIQIGLPDTDQASDNRSHNHNCNIENKPLHIGPTNRVVKNVSNHQGIDQSKASCQQDGEHDEYNLPFIRCEGLYNTPHGASIRLASTFLLIF